MRSAHGSSGRPNDRWDALIWARVVHHNLGVKIAKRMTTRTWSHWRSRVEPLPTRAALVPDEYVVLVEDLYGIRDDAVVVMDDLLSFIRRGGDAVVVMNADDAVLGRSNDEPWPTRMIPAVRIACQADLRGPGALALYGMRTDHRALYIVPEEPLDLSVYLVCPTCRGTGEMPCAHESYAVEQLGCPDCRGEKLITLVVVDGRETILRHENVRHIEEQCAKAGVAFSFLRWGGTTPSGTPIEYEGAMLDGVVMRALPPGL